MSAWGSSSSSCDALLSRLERNDPSLTVCTVLPTKQFGDAQLDRLSSLLLSLSRPNTHWHTLAASGHAVSAPALERLGQALAAAAERQRSSVTTTSSEKNVVVGGPLQSVAVGDASMGDPGVMALCRGLLSGGAPEKKHHRNGDSDDDDVLADDDDDAFVLSLKHLDLSYKGLGLEGLACVAQTLSHSCCRNVTSLNLSRNHFGNQEEPQNVRAIATTTATTDTSTVPAASFFLPDPLFEHVEDLDLSSCEIDATLAQSIFGKLFQGKKHNSGSGSKVRKLNVAGNPLGDDGLASMLTHLGHCLEGLHVSNCSLTDAGLRRWNEILCQSADGCCCWPGIRTVDLSHNLALTADGMNNWSSSPWLCDPTVLPALQEILLVGNRGMGAVGVQALVSGIGRRFSKLNCDTDNGSLVMSPPPLMTLDLSETNCSAMAAALAVRCRGIKSLRLYNNQLGSEGFDAIAEALRKVVASASSACDWHTLDFAGNGANQASVVNLLMAVLELLSLSEDSANIIALQCLVIGGNDCGENVEDVVRKIQQIRPTLDIARDKFQKR